MIFNLEVWKLAFSITLIGYVTGIIGMILFFSIIVLIVKYPLFLIALIFAIIFMHYYLKHRNHTNYLIGLGNAYHDLFVEKTKHKIVSLEKKIVETSNLANFITDNKINDTRQAMNYLVRYVDKKTSFFPPKGSPAFKNKFLLQIINEILNEIRKTHNIPDH